MGRIYNSFISLHLLSFSWTKIRKMLRLVVIVSFKEYREYQIEQTYSFLQTLCLIHSPNTFSKNFQWLLVKSLPSALLWVITLPLHLLWSSLLSVYFWKMFTHLTRLALYYPQYAFCFSFVSAPQSLKEGFLYMPYPSPTLFHTQYEGWE